MFTNACCTLYLRENIGFTMIRIPACFWQETSAYDQSKYGSKSVDGVKIIIPLASLSGYRISWKITEDSYAAKGYPSGNITDDISEMIEQKNVFRITSVSDRLYGLKGMQHITIEAR